MHPNVSIIDAGESLVFTVKMIDLYPTKYKQPRKEKNDIITI